MQAIEEMYLIQNNLGKKDSKFLIKTKYLIRVNFYNHDNLDL